jgi:formylglycine-generating enzyme required for sulfatase activity
MRPSSLSAIALTFAAAMLLASSAAEAERRIALVIGNGAYTTISPLRNPRSDAALMADTLSAVGFEVVSALDVDRRAMGRAIRDFGTLLRGAGPDAVGLFYYAGHGVQHDGDNYLIPLDANVDSGADLSIEAFRAADVLAQMSQAENALNIAILDACRNNPFPSGTRNTERGLARVSAFNGSMIAFAAAPGESALDGSGANSPYTAALAEAMQTPGLTVEQVFKQARVDVLSVTDGAQTPWEESSLVGEFYFVPDDGTSDGQTSLGEEALFWAEIKDSGDVALFEEFLRRFPGGTFAGLAERRLENMREQVAVGVFPDEQWPPLPPTPELDRTCEDGVITTVAGALQCLRPGDEFRDCPACPVMVVVPAGTYLRGAPAEDPHRNGWEKLQHQVTLDRPFAIGKFELTFDAWDFCVRTSGCANPILNDRGWGRDRRPVINVTWPDAQDYLAWASAETGAHYRLPSETEWEYAARGGAGNESPFHFGADYSRICEFGNVADSASTQSPRFEDCSDGIGDQTAEVGGYAPNPYGLHDMNGNVREWVEDCTAYYSPQDVDGRARTSDCRSPDFRMKRGGSWADPPAQARSAARSFGYFDYPDRSTGFRAARTLEPAVP